MDQAVDAVLEDLLPNFRHIAIIALFHSDGFITVFQDMQRGCSVMVHLPAVPRFFDKQRLICRVDNRQRDPLTVQCKWVVGLTLPVINERGFYKDATR